MDRAKPLYVRGQVGRVQELGLIERADDGSVPVPCEAVEIVLPLARVA
ncbi:hypothetical protein [Accumulibacter sp.]|nr:hypothetical protein [Accumulibacter sp.]MCM8611303.1 hypothetical protein [Accumulibacter sp.]MCM8635050.1 hypothetical protein [Accumulibacter sp.]MCM8639838.1 hypothetical protein [Accumulibacter sp.]